MKEIISQILKEDYSFDRKQCPLSFSCSQITCEAQRDKIVKGSFFIVAEDQYKAEGYVYSSDLRMMIPNPQFGGLRMEVCFQFDAHGLTEGSTQEGNLSIVSNMGEYELPYRIEIAQNLPQSSLGEIRNLFHFANLAQANWQEAVSMFYSPDFINVLIGNDEQFRTLYRGLSANIGNEQNVENFLQIAKKKTRASYMTDVNEVEMEAKKETTMHYIRIIREGWGYTNLQVHAEGDFILLDQEQIREEEFIGNVKELPYYINEKCLHRGKNQGAIILSDIYGEKKINITIHKKGTVPVEHREERKNTIALMRLYLAFRTGKKSKMEWMKECNSLITAMIMANPDSIVKRLYQVQLLLTEKRTEEAGRILERIGFLLEEKTVLPEVEGYYYYLLSLSGKDEALLQSLAEKTEYLYVQNVQNWRLAWLLLYMKEEYVDEEQKKWDLIKQQYEYGNASPILFLEALHVMLQRPTVMSEITDFELAFLTFARRKKVLTREIRNRFIFLVSKIKVFSKEIFELLADCYKTEEKDSTLEAICTHLMKGNRIGKEYFVWYSKAVEQELRITHLYEYYIMSIDMKFEGKLPKIILMYFAYRSNLDYERNAFLYSNILKHRQEYQDIYMEYYPIIEKFACEQILKKRISENLAFIYKKVMLPMLQEESYATAYAELTFMRWVWVTNPCIKEIIVVNENLKQEFRYSIYQEESVIPMIGERDKILLEDSEGNRYTESEFYHTKRAMSIPQNITGLLKNASLNVTFAMYIAEDSGERVTITKENESVLMWLSMSEEITEAYRTELMINLAEYYFDNDLIAPLDELLLRFEPIKLSGKDRETCIRIMVARGMYDKAFEWLRNCGIESIDQKILVRLCDRLLMRSDYEYEPELLKICEGIFQKGKYDETILNYLLLYEQGATKNLKALWRAADSFGMDVQRLLENMLIQILYTRVDIGEQTNIFMEYVTYGAAADVEKAFLSYLSYEYFVKQKVIDESVFDRVLYLYQISEDIPTVCKLAYLKKEEETVLAHKLSEEEQEAVVAFLRQLWHKKIFFSLFLSYREVMPKLELMKDQSYIEYRGREGSRVILHYVMECEGKEERDYRKEEMKHMFGGIYVKSFILFYGERVMYYITEEDGRQEKLTQSSVLQKNELEQNQKEDRFAMINNVVISRDMQDYETYCKLAMEYAKRSYLVNQLFTPDK